tara:strand:- start:3464 stop:4597 length:1134 start_codon:yes stop_codon:yes gene_type:complete
MSEEVPARVIVDEDHRVLPFRLREIEPFFSFSELHPIAKPLDTIQVELRFQSKLAVREWDMEHWTTLGLGVLAFLLGSISTEIFSGGDATKSGIDGLGVIGGLGYFQMLLSIIAWGLFSMQLWRLFPIMRIHALSLLFFWNMTVFAQILFHKSRVDFPLDAKLGDMMEGTLATLVVMFFIYYFGKAVVETRDYHVEEYHVHEDVRLMEIEMAEHSLRGWGLILTLWFVMITVSGWSGAHFVAERGAERIGSLVTHIITGTISIPLFIGLIWYPQRMLGTGAQVKTRAAINAKLELDSQTADSGNHESRCPECEATVEITRNEDGVLIVPCATEGCSAKNLIGSECQLCSAMTSTRYDCPQCGVNAPALDFLPDLEAW